MPREIALCGCLAFSCLAALCSTPRSLLSRLPLHFEPGPSGTAYVAHGGNFNLILHPNEDVFDIGGEQVRAVWRGAGGRTLLEAVDPLPGCANYFVGDARAWRTGIKTYARVRRTALYPGINMIFHGEDGRLEYDFIVAPHASPQAIELQFQGPRSLRIEPNGDLVVETRNGALRWKRPEAYQKDGGNRVGVAARFVVARNRVHFELGAYDHRRELVIDPTLAYASYLGGSSNEGARGIAVDAAGNIYIAGNTVTTNLPVTAGVIQPSFGGQTAGVMQGDAFVAKFSASGALAYLTYLGGSADDTASAIAVDAAGNAYVTGATTSTDFPVSGSPFQKTFAGAGPAASQMLRFGDAFVAKLNPAGTQLIYSTYLGGSQDDFATAIAIDSAGNAYVAGGTRSSNFPVTSGVYQSFLSGTGGELIKSCCNLPLFDPGDAFVAKLNPAGSGLIFSTYLGGSSDDVALAVALDSSNNVFVGGYTLSINFPATPGAFQKQYAGAEQENDFFIFGDGFVTKLNATGTALMYSTYFGGNGDDNVSAIAVDSAGNAYLTGSTSTMNWKTTSGAFQPSFGGCTSLFTCPANYVEQLIGDAYIAKLNPSGSGLVYMSYLGGNGNDGGTGIAVDSAGNAWITGFADSTNFPVTANALQPKMAGDGGQPLGSYYSYGDAFLSVVNPAGTALLYSSYFGGSFDDGALGIALDNAGNAYLTGVTISQNLPTSSNAFQKTYGGIKPGPVPGSFGPSVGWAKGDAFVAGFSGISTSTPAISSVSNAFGGSPTIAGNTWVAIKGSNLAPDARTWQNSDFVNNQMPAMLDGVTVTMNGTSAYLYYISGGQLNVLSPPNLAAGPVQVVVSASGTPSQAFTAQAQSLSPSLFVFDAAGHVVAQHFPSYTDVGPTTLYPGLTTPAQRGETIILYGNGFGPTDTAVTAGSAAQSGNLKLSLVQVQVGGTPANVLSASLVSPGLYQFDLVIPQNAASGDIPITVLYNGQSTQAGAVLTVQ